jgi:hypothetical protein
MIIVQETKGQKGLKNNHEDACEDEGEREREQKKRLMNEMMMVLNLHQVIKGCATERMKRKKKKWKFEKIGL